MKMNDLSAEKLEEFCRELGELLTKHKVTIDICSCGEVLNLREWHGRITCCIGPYAHHDDEPVLWIDES